MGQYIYLLGRKLNSMQSCKSIVTMVFECYALYRYGLQYNVLMMSVLQEIKGLTNFIILPVGRPVSIQNFGLNVYTVYLF